MKELVIRIKVDEDNPPTTPEEVVELMWEVDYVDGGGVLKHSPVTGRKKLIGFWEVREEAT